MESRSGRSRWPTARSVLLERTVPSKVGEALSEEKHQTEKGKCAFIVSHPGVVYAAVRVILSFCCSEGNMMDNQDHELGR